MAIRLKFYFMKKELVFIFLFLTSVYGYSQTAEFLYSADSVKCRIINDDGETRASDCAGVLEYQGEVKKIGFREDPKLDNAANHYFKINDKFLSFKPVGDDKISGTNYYYKELSNPITLQPGNCISLYRNTNDDKGYVGKIVVKIPKNYFDDKVKFEAVDTNYIIDGIEDKPFRFKVDNKSGCILYDYVVCYNEKEIQGTIDAAGYLNFTISPDSVDEANAPVCVKFRVKDHDYYDYKEEIKLCDITVNDNQSRKLGYSVLKFIVIAIVGLFLILGLYLLSRKDKFNCESPQDGHMLKGCSAEGDLPAGDFIAEEGCGERMNEESEVPDSNNNDQSAINAQDSTFELKELQEKYNKLKSDYDKQKETCQVIYEQKLKEAEKSGIKKGKEETEIKYKKKIAEEYISLHEYDEMIKPLKSRSDEALKAKVEAEDNIKIKERELREAENQIKSLKKELQDKCDALIKQVAANAKLKDVAKKKNMHYLFQVYEALSDISETFKDVYKDINNPQMKEFLISPMIRGVGGLSTGILSWAEDFTIKVLEESETFFGGDFLVMSETAVKEQLAKKFISNVIKSDSFSKFVRLYQLSTVPFIRKQFVTAQLNIDVLNKLYYKMYSLITDFGYTIICPTLFEEKYSESKYQWFNSTNLFTIIDLPEAERNKVKGSEIIIDINQIGFSSIWVNRKATAVTPDF